MRKPFVTFGIAVALVALVFIYYGNPAIEQDKKIAPENNTAVTTGDSTKDLETAPVNNTAVITGDVKEEPKTAPVNSTVTATGTVKEFTISAKNFNFAPNTMTVKKGDRVRITLANGDGFHDLVIDEFGVATKKINTGMTEVVEFTADKTGSFEYYCSVGSHRMMGMKGTLVVQ